MKILYFYKLRKNLKKFLCKMKLFLSWVRLLGKGIKKGG